VTPSSDGAKANRCCCANERRHQAERIAIPAAAVSPPTPTAELRSNSATRRTIRASATATRRLCADIVARALVNRAGCGGRNNYSTQLMKTGKTKVFRRVRVVFVLRRIKRALFTPFVR
jgi:hypothetical protein